jgi:hypothetical protein
MQPMLRWFGRHLLACNAIVVLTAAALLLGTATSFGFAATIFEHDLGLHHGHGLDAHHDHEHDNSGDPLGCPDEIATHHVHVVALVPPVGSLPWSPGRTVLCEFPDSSVEQGCLYRLERIPKHFAG